MRQDIYYSINHLAEPTYFGKAAVKYGLSVKQVDELKREAEGNTARLNQLYFNAGFAAGRAYQNDERKEKENMKYTAETIEKIIKDMPDRCGLSKEDLSAVMEYVQKQSQDHSAEMTSAVFWATLATYCMGFQRGLKYQGRNRKGVNNG